MNLESKIAVHTRHLALMQVH